MNNKKKVQKVDMLPLTSDYVFKRIFGRTGNEDITRSFLKAATGIEFNKRNWKIE